MTLTRSILQRRLPNGDEHVVAVEALDQLLPAVHLIDELKAKQEQCWHVVKVGRTHLQDATPLTFGQEVSGYVAALEHDRDC